jgi:hypothetical protein
MEAEVEEEMRGWKAKMVGMGLVNASSTPCPGGPAVMSAGGSLDDDDTAPDCQTTPGACSANAHCIPVSTAHRYVCLSVYLMHWLLTPLLFLVLDTVGALVTLAT